MDINEVIAASQKRILQEAIFEIEQYQIPPDWRSTDVTRFILNKLRGKEGKL